MNAQEMIKAVYEDGTAEINGTEYRIEKPPFKAARSVLAYSSKIGSQMQSMDFGFIDSVEFEPIEKIINRYVFVEGVQLEKDGMKDHWDTHQADYIQLITVALGVISYPFMSGNAGS